MHLIIITDTKTTTQLPHCATRTVFELEDGLVEDAVSDAAASPSVGLSGAVTVELPEGPPPSPSSSSPPASPPSSTAFSVTQTLGSQP